MLLDKYNVVFIEDDVYVEFYVDKCLFLLIKYFMKEGDSMLCLLFFKFLVVGYRIGWVVVGKCVFEI